MKLPKLLGRRKTDDEDDDVDGDEGFDAPPSDADPGTARPFDEAAEDAHRRRVLFLGALGGSVIIIAVVFVAALFLGEGSSGPAPSASLDLSTTGQTPGAGLALAPPGAETPGGGMAAEEGAKTAGNAMASPAGAPAGGDDGEGGADVAGLVAPSVPRDAFAGLPAPPAAQPLSDFPDPDLTESGPGGDLPKVGAGGRRPWEVYAKPFDVGTDVARIAIIMVGLGMSPTATQAAINHLPGTVTLAFDPLAPDLPEWVALARRGGHEVLAMMPLDPDDFPAHDPGPLAIKAQAPADENVKRLEEILKRVPMAIGVITGMGSNVLPVDDRIRPVLEALKTRGLVIVDDGTVANSRVPAMATRLRVPRAFAHGRLDADLSAAAIDAALQVLEKEARKGFITVTTARPYPVVLARIAAWAPTLSDKKLALVPVSAIIDKQFVP